jgi:hypothetical protein
MTHLTHTTQKNLFETTVEARPNRETGNERGLMPSMPSAPKPFAVATAQTPEEARALNRACYNYDWLCVENLSNRTRGKHY